MNTLIHTMRSSAIVCLVLGSFAAPSHASISQETDIGFQNVPTSFTIIDDIVAHSNQGGKKKGRMLHLWLAKRSMPNPLPDADTIGGLLVEGLAPLWPERSDDWVTPGSMPVLPDTNGFNGAESSGGIVPAPGALLVLGLAAARRRRRRR